MTESIPSPFWKYLTEEHGEQVGDKEGVNRTALSSTIFEANEADILGDKLKGERTCPAGSVLSKTKMVIRFVCCPSSSGYHGWGQRLTSFHCIISLDVSSMGLKGKASLVHLPSPLCAERPCAERQNPGPALCRCFGAEPVMLILLWVSFTGSWLGVLHTPSKTQHKKKTAVKIGQGFLSVSFIWWLRWQWAFWEAGHINHLFTLQFPDEWFWVQNNWQR